MICGEKYSKFRSVILEKYDNIKFHLLTSDVKSHSASIRNKIHLENKKRTSYVST